MVNKKQLVFEMLAKRDDVPSSEIISALAKKGHKISYKWISRCRQAYRKATSKPAKAVKSADMSTSETIRNILRKYRLPNGDFPVADVVMKKLNKLGISCNSSLIYQQIAMLRKSKDKPVPPVSNAVPAVTVVPVAANGDLAGATMLTVVNFCRDNHLTIKELRQVLDDIETLKLRLAYVS